jgi:hypothetical protein
MKKMLNEGNQTHNFVLCVCDNFCETILLRFRLTSYGSGSGSTQQKVTVPTASAPQH